jgi:NAD(P)-dependent dehydrogenase (short-subunit alcohol dehydrogenase family)
VDVVFHLAARVADHGPPEAFRATIVDGTRNVLAACAGAGRFVYVSSYTALGLGRHLRGMAEDAPAVRAGIPYADGKLDAEELVRASEGRFARGCVIVRPANVIGPGSAWVTDVARQLHAALVPLIDGGRHGANLIGVDNLVDGLLLAADVEAATGKTYHLRDAWQASWRRYLTDLAAMLHSRPRGALSFEAAWALGGAAERVCAPLGLRPPLTRMAAGMLGRDNEVDTSRAREELGWRTRVSYEETMDEIRAWVGANLEPVPPLGRRLAALLPGVRLRGKRVALTGGSRGIGRALALALGREGASLALLARDGRRLEESARLASAAGAPRAVPVVADITEEAAVRAAVESAARELGGIDIFCNVAGVTLERPLSRAAPADFSRVMETNLLGAVRCTGAALPHLRRSRGLLVNVASVIVRNPFPHLGVYAASKWALAAYSHTLRQELHGSGVRVLTVYPAIVRTEMVDEEPVLQRCPSQSAEACAAQIVAAIRAGRQEADTSWLQKLAQGAFWLHPPLAGALNRLFLPPGYR